MSTVARVLPPSPVATFADHAANGGGDGLTAARSLAPTAVVELVEASGLRGRGGAGFPTGAKWRTVAQHRSSNPPTVVVNAAEGEPSTFKDRTILRTNPFAVLEGALVAAHAVGAAWIVVALKVGFETERERLRHAIAELPDDWTRDVTIEVVTGPRRYLLGEETALLEVLNGRPPFPRVAPPFRRGVDDVVSEHDDVDRRGAATIELTGPDAADVSDTTPPALVDNVETLANVAGIVARGPEWFRSLGSAESPGTIVCTVTGSVAEAGVFEVAMGTPLSEVIALAGRPTDGAAIVGVLPGVSNGIVTADQLDTPLTYEDMSGIGSGLGSASFLVLDERDDLAAVAAGVSRFLAVESCGQCTGCKVDGTTISRHLDAVIAHDPWGELDVVRAKLDTVADGARCALGRQHETVVRSLLDADPSAFRGHIERTREPVGRAPIGELDDLVEGVAVIDDELDRRQPDWTTGELDSGRTPVERAPEIAAEMAAEMTTDLVPAR